MVFIRITQGVFSWSARFIILVLPIYQLVIIAAIIIFLMKFRRFSVGMLLKRSYGSIFIAIRPILGGILPIRY